MGGSYNGGFHNFGSGNLSLGFQQQDRLKQEAARRIVNASQGGKKKVTSTDGTRVYDVKQVGGAPPKARMVIGGGGSGPGSTIVTKGDPDVVVAGPGLGVVTSGPAFKPVYQSPGFGIGPMFDHGFSVPGGYYPKGGAAFQENEIEYKSSEMKPFRMMGIEFVPDAGWSQGQDFEDVMGETPLQWPYAAAYGVNMVVNTALHYSGFGGTAGLQKSAQQEVAAAKKWTVDNFGSAMSGLSSQWTPGQRNYSRVR